MVDVTSEPLELDPLIAAVRGDDCGGIVAFVGVVRNRSDEGRAVDGLSYEAYPAMAVPLMRELRHETEQRFPGVRIAMVHRVGTLGIGEPSVAVAAAAPHRGLAFDACEYAIDELKKRIPIWKKEHYVDGGARWRENEPQAP